MGTGLGLVLGLDVGTQSTKGLLIDANQGLVLARSSKAYGLIEGLAPGAAEQDPAIWEQAAVDVLQPLIVKAAELKRPIEALGVSGQQHGCVLLDSEGQSVRPAKLWCDTQTSSEAAELSQALGRPIPTGYTASKVLWVARHEPDAWERTTQVLLPHDFLNLRLTGEASMEAGDASGTGWFDPRERVFDVQAMNAIDPDLSAKLPGLTAAGEPAGVVSESGARRFGLAAGTLVASGGGDNMMSAIGAGASAPGISVVSMGTSGTVFTYADQPVIDPEGLIAPFCDSSGGWLPLLCVMNLTGVSEGVVRLSGRDHDDLTAAAAKLAPGCEGLLWLPFLVGERVPDLPDASGTLLGMRDQHLQGAMLYRAALEGTSLNLGWGVGRLNRLGVETSRVHLVGGAARNPLWRQILAAVLDAEVQVLAEPEAAALGAGLQAAWTLGRQGAGGGPSLQELSAPFLGGDAGSEQPDRELVQHYAEQAVDYAAALDKYYGVE